MIGVSDRPWSSSAARSAPTRPSIMSLGATASAPASAWETAVRASSSSVGVVVDHAVRPQHAAVAVARVLAQAQVGDHQQVGMGGLDRARGELDHALVVPRARALLVLVGRQAEQQHAGDAERGARCPPPRRRRRSRGGRCPAATGSASAARRPRPRTSGRSDGSTDSSVSRTRPRSRPVRRSRRRRVAGNTTPESRRTVAARSAPTRRMPAPAPAGARAAPAARRR